MTIRYPGCLSVRLKKPKEAKQLLDMAARWVLTEVPANEQCLIIGYGGRFYTKGERSGDLGACIMDRLPDNVRLGPDDKPRVHWLTYGQHTSTNAYRDVKYVMLLGLHYTSDATPRCYLSGVPEHGLARDNPGRD